MERISSALIVLDGDGGAEKWANENNIGMTLEYLKMKSSLKFKPTLISQTVK